MTSLQYIKYHGNAVFKEKMKLRSRLTYILTTGTVESYDDILKQALGASYQAVRKHLESQFISNMNWDNYGIEWEVDHIVPLCTAKTIEEVHQLFYYMNLQPLPPLKNRPGGPFKV
jgi:hypothetical protein